MPQSIGRLNPQYYQSSGETTPQAQLPEQFRTTPVATSPLANQLTIAPVSYANYRRGPVVQRRERMQGYRIGYRRVVIGMPVRRDGADGTPRPWNSAANRNERGPIRTGSYNDQLFQAGYPGFNLGLSFKVPTLNTAPSGGRRSITETPGLISVASRTNVLVRSS
jgi:hypothetical protein